MRVRRMKGGCIPKDILCGELIYGNLMAVPSCATWMFAGAIWKLWTSAQRAGGGGSKLQYSCRSVLKKRLKLGEEKIQNSAEEREESQTEGTRAPAATRDQAHLHPLPQGLSFPHWSHKPQPTLVLPHRYNTNRLGCIMVDTFRSRPTILPSVLRPCKL